MTPDSSTHPLSIVNHTNADLTGLSVEEFDHAGRLMGPAPGAYGQDILVRSLKHGDKKLAIRGYARGDQCRFTLEFANGSRVAVENKEKTEIDSRHRTGKLDVSGPGAERYRIIQHAETGRVVFAIHEVSELSSWMSVLADDLLLGKMTIPGTHETCALYGGDLVECQTKTLRQQLDAGIRFVDIRCRHIEDVFTIHHGLVYQHINFGAGVRDVCLQFLADHPSECIIMSIKKEYKEVDCNRTFEQTFDWYLEGNRASWYLNDTIPKLGDVRGKIVLFRRFTGQAPVLGINASDWKDDATFEINNSAKLKVQDKYKVPTVCDISKKWDHIKSLLKEAADATDDRWYVNFTSGTSSGAYPYTVAKGSPGIPGENNRLHGYLTDNTAGKAGTILMDFFEYPDNILVQQLINKN
jgi:1-phosphatidylinositol phosphodiesterase